MPPPRARPRRGRASTWPGVAGAVGGPAPCQTVATRPRGCSSCRPPRCPLTPTAAPCHGAFWHHDGPPPRAASAEVAGGKGVFHFRGGSPVRNDALEHDGRTVGDG